MIEAVGVRVREKGEEGARFERDQNCELDNRQG